jgi:hypothetical protein
VTMLPVFVPNITAEQISTIQAELVKIPVE